MDAAGRLPATRYGRVPSRLALGALIVLVTACSLPPPPPQHGWKAVEHKGMRLHVPADWQVDTPDPFDLWCGEAAVASVWLDDRTVAVGPGPCPSSLTLDPEGQEYQPGPPNVRVFTVSNLREVGGGEEIRFPGRERAQFLSYGEERPSFLFPDRDRVVEFRDVDPHVRGRILASIRFTD